MGSPRYPLLPSFRFKALGSSHSWSCSSCCVSASPGGLQPFNTVTSFLSPLALMPPLLNLHLSYTTLAYEHPTPLLPTLQLFSLHLSHPPVFLVVLQRLLLPLPPLTRSGLFNAMLEVFEPEPLNISTLYSFIL